MTAWTVISHIYILGAMLLTETVPAGPAPTMASLKPASGQPVAGEAFCHAELTLQNHQPQVIQAVALRWQDGGPTLFQPAVIPPGASATLIVPLPAVSEQQTYDVRLLGSNGLGGEPLAVLKATISWPTEQVNPDLFLDWRYRQIALVEPTWPSGLMRNLWVTLMAGCLVMAGAGTFLRRWRRVIVLLIVLGSMAAVTMLLVNRSDPVGVSWARLGGGLTGERQNIMVVQTRRTAQWSSAARLVPLYLSRYQMQQDDMIIEPGRGVRVTLHPSGPRLFRVDGQLNSR